MSRRGETLVAIAFAGTLAAELLLHWFLKSGLSPTLRLLYLSNSKLNSITMLVDNYLPAAAVGVVNGWVGCQWSTRKLNTLAMVIAAGVTGAQVLYSFFFPKVLLWWWPPQWSEGLFWFATAIIFALFASYFGETGDGRDVF